MPRTVFEPSAPNLRDQYQDADTGDVYRHLSEWKGLFQSLVAVFEEHGAEVVTPPTESYWNAIEPWITGAYSRRSLPVPATVVTNEAERVREFVATHGEATIRPVNSREPPEVLDGPELEDEYVDRLTKSPAIIRETVSGVNVRSYVLKGELVGTCRYEHDSDPPLAPGRWLERMATSASEFTPSPSLRETVLEAAAFTPSSLTAVDLRVENDVECAVFDVRTSGRFVVADASGATDVAGALAEHLAAD